MTSVYLDASGIVKLGTTEPESLALRAWLRGRSPSLTAGSPRWRSPSDRRKGKGGAARGRAATREDVASEAIAEMDAGIANRAAELTLATLRALDAIHLATALAIGDELAAFVTYDARLADAARAAGLEVIAPA